jgi:hypothetical protein
MTCLRNRFVQKLILLGVLAASATTIHAALPLCNQTCTITYNACLRSFFWQTPAQCYSSFINCITKCG